MRGVAGTLAALSGLVGVVAGLFAISVIDGGLCGYLTEGSPPCPDSPYFGPLAALSTWLALASLVTSFFSADAAGKGHWDWPRMRKNLARTVVVPVLMLGLQLILSAFR